LWPRIWQRWPMPFELKVVKTTELRCTNCGKIITGSPNSGEDLLRE